MSNSRAGAETHGPHPGSAAGVSGRRLIHLNGPPGVGKSTLAARYAAEHPGTLDCEIDLLRGLVGGVEEDFGRAGALIRPAAVAMISAFLEHSGDVVLPQMIARPAELDRFRRAATDVGAEHVHVLLTGDPGDVAGRFRARPTDLLHHRLAARAVADDGGTQALRRWQETLAELTATQPDVHLLPTSEGDVDHTYARLLVVLARRDGRA